MKKKLFFLLGLCLVFISPVGGQTQVFVSNGSGNDSNDGSSWESAKQTIAAGIAVAGNNGTVYVKAGTYNISSQITLSNGVSVKGGYKMISAGTDTTKRNLPNTNSYWTNDVYCTIINGAGDHRIASVGTDCLLEGCVLNNGFTNTMGAGALINGGTVRYCIIKECNAMNDNTFTAEGGGVYMQNGGLLSNSVITLCRGDIGPAVAGGNASLINNTITRNWPTHCGTARDYDGNIYHSVVIGNQCWMRTNLRTTHYNDGTAIVQGGSASSATPSYYIDYIGMPVINFPVYGYLYNWAAAMYGNPSSDANPSGVQGICPNGWHLPSNAEWDELYNFVNSRDVYLCNGTMAKALCHSIGWYTYTGSCAVGYNAAANNASRFGAVPAGVWTGSFGSYTSAAYFWSATESRINIANQRHFNYNSGAMTSGTSSKSDAMSVRCLKNTEIGLPIVSINDFSISGENVTIYCNNTSGGGTVTARGVCWSTSINPTLSDAHTSENAGDGAFSSILHNLSPGVTYHFRAYATNSVGTVYSEDVASPCPLSMTDIDNNIYPTVFIGSQCWMKENLRVTRTNDGGSMSFSKGASGNGSYYYAVDGDLNNITSGYTYSNYAARRVCPTGWHLPTSAEFEQLINFVKNHPQNPCPGSAGKALADKNLWQESSVECSVGCQTQLNNFSGFSAKPAANYYSGYGGLDYTSACFWIISNIESYAYMKISNNSPEVTSSHYATSYGECSVRCIKD